MQPIRKDPAGFKTTELHNARILAGVVNDFEELLLRVLERKVGRALEQRELLKPHMERSFPLTPFTPKVASKFGFGKFTEDVYQALFDAVGTIEEYIDKNAAEPASKTITAASVGHGVAWADKNIAYAKISASGLPVDAKALYLPNDPRMIRMAENAMVAEIKNLTGFYATNLKRELRTAWEKGETMPQITKRIQDATGLAKNKAVTIARTETLRAGNAAATGRYKSVGVEKVEWVTAQDDRLCEECDSLHGEIFDMDKIPDLPVHPNCRCTVVPLITIEG